MILDVGLARTHLRGLNLAKTESFIPFFIGYLEQPVPPPTNLTNTVLNFLFYCVHRWILHLIEFRFRYKLLDPILPKIRSQSSQIADGISLIRKKCTNFELKVRVRADYSN